MLRGPSRWVSWGVGVGVCAALGFAALAIVPRLGPSAPLAPAPVVTSSSAPDARSCKPSAPVLVTLASTARPGVWQIHLEALAGLESVEIALGAAASGQDVARRVAWTGSLAQGETRDIEAAFAPPQGASAVWVEASAGTEPGAIQRGRAAIELRDGRPMAAVAAEPLGGRLTTDPQTGEKVVEFIGSSEGAR